MEQNLACIRWNNGEVQCWGEDSAGLDWQTLRLQGELEVASGVVICGLQTSGTPECRSALYDYTGVRFDDFVSLKPGEGALCGLTSAGEVECPFIDAFFEGRHQNIPEGPFTALEVARGDYVCGETSQKEWRCDGDIDFHRLPPEEQFEKVNLGRGLHCGLKQDGAIRCWGTVASGPLPMFEGSFQDFDTEGFQGCGVDMDGGLQCVGDFAPDTSEAEGIRFRKITVTLGTACGVVGDDKVFCFGRRISPPPDDIAYVP